MKFILALLRRRSAMASAIALAGLLTACGQKGPLYLPAKPKPVPPAAAPAQPAPEKSADPASK